MTKTQTQSTKTSAPKPLFGLSGTQLKLVTGGSGIIGEQPAPPPKP